MADITKINLNGTNYNLVDSAATSAIASEVSRAQGAESAITSALSAEVVARQSADTQIQTALSGKADASTTLSGYGITDAYTKTEVDNALSGKADTATTLSGYGITDAYTKTETDNAITAATSGLQATLTPGTGIEITSGNVINCTIDTGLYVVVQELPAQPAAGNENKIHLVPDPSGVTGNEYIEYLWKGDEWEEIGKTTVETDLSDYWTSAQTQSAITSATSGLATTLYVDSAITAATSGLASTGYVDSAITAATSGLATETYVQNAVSGLASESYVTSAITAAVSGITAEYSAATETLILNIPNPSA